MVAAPHILSGSQANSAVRVGLLGCGGRGTEVARSMVANGARVVALADRFDDQLERAQTAFRGIPASQVFRGVQAAEQIAGSNEVDAIIIATPPYFHPEHLDIVVTAGKHAYCEKPVAVDVPGAKRVVEIGRKAEGKLSLDVGFQLRSAPPFAELVKRIHGGALGEIAFGTAHYLCPFLEKPDWAGVPASEKRLRNWMYDRVLSGDIIVEQNIHVIDICNWVLQAHPVKASGFGSSKGRPNVGDCYGHFSATFTYPNDVVVNFASTQFGKGPFDANEQFFGSRGASQSPYSGAVEITGERPWKWAAPTKPKAGAGKFSITGAFSDNLARADAEKHKSFLASITSGKFHNQASTGAESSLSAMLGRQSAYLKRELSWEELLKSEEKWELK